VLPFFCLSDFIAQGARMPAVESLAQGFGQGCLLRIGNNHADPGDGLEKRPVQADGSGQGERYQELWQP
jgi:hypothetical protein